MPRIQPASRPADFATRGVDVGALVEVGGVPARVIGFSRDGAVCLSADWTLSERASGDVAAARAQSKADTLTTIRAIASARLDASDAETVAAVESAVEWYETQRAKP